ncbi:hypothetical protein ABI59_17725 [Acidobacteria bacterium Mor1]|nr:hypothetical protein ABI59_17725 [Acidobacteria bacterium Mor1]
MGPSTDSDSSNSVAVSGVAAVAILIWGGTAVANKFAVAEMDALTAGVLRSTLAGLIAAAIALAARLPRPRSAGQTGLLLFSGLASFAAWPMLMSLGLGRTTANHAGLIMATLPVLTGLIGALVEGRRLRFRWWLGCAVALGGTAALILWRTPPGAGGQGPSLAGDLIVLGGTLICACGYVAGGNLSASIGAWSTTFWGLTAALTVLLPALAVLAPQVVWSEVGPVGWSSILYMTLLSSLVGYAAWFWALGRGGVARIAAWQFLQPVLTVLFAAWLLDEGITLPLVLAALAILLGTAMARRWSR